MLFALKIVLKTTAKQAVQVRSETAPSQEGALLFNLKEHKNEQELLNIVTASNRQLVKRASRPTGLLCANPSLDFARAFERRLLCALTCRRWISSSFAVINYLARP